MRRTRMSRWSAHLALVAAVLVLQVPVLAHHSFTAEFDAQKPVTLKGTVQKVFWTNPHAHLKVDVAGDGGKITTWDFELGSPNALIRRGWSAQTLKTGDVVTISGY